VDLKAKRNALPPDPIDKIKQAYVDDFRGKRDNAAYGWVRADD
jgi:hypothetical protein